MSLFPEKTDGSPAPEWDAYMFEPKEDITAYELALIIRRLSTSVPHLLDVLYEPVYVRKDGKNFTEMATVARHFRLVYR